MQILLIVLIKNDIPKKLKQISAKNRNFIQKILFSIYNNTYKRSKCLKHKKSIKKFKGKYVIKRIL